MAGLIAPTEINVGGECYGSSLERNQDYTDGKRKMPLWGDNTLVTVFHLNQFACSRFDPRAHRSANNYTLHSSA